MKKWIAAILMVFMLCGACAQADHLAGQAAEDSGNIELARQLWEEAAAQGDVDAAFSLGYRYYIGKYGDVDYAKAMEYYVMAAELGHVKAQYNLGVMYRNAYGVEKDYQKALEWYHKAAEQGHGSAMNGIGYIYGEQGDYAAAMEWYLKAHATGYEKLKGAECTNIGQLYCYGHGVEQDYQKAMEWYILGAQAGSAVSMYDIGIMYQNGYGVEMDYAKAVQWWEKAVEQDPQYVDALEWLSWGYRQNEYGMTQDDEKARMYHERAYELGSEYVIGGLAHLLMEGAGGEKNYAEAIRLFEMKAAEGDAESMRHIAWMYSEGGYGIEQDYVKAAQWWEKAVEQDPQDVKSLEYLSWVYRQNEYGMTQDDEKARTYHERAYELGSEYNLKRLAYMMMEGIGGEKNYANAIRLYEKVAAEGDVESMRHIGWMYREGGYGVETDEKAAFDWLLKAADLGDEWAADVVACYYFYGEVVEKNYAEAIRLYEKLAANGDADSMGYIGWMYSEGGYGIEKDDEAAFEWLLKAAELGDGFSMCKVGDYYNEGKVVEKNEQLGQEWKDKAVQYGHTHSN